MSLLKRDIVWCIFRYSGNLLLTFCSWLRQHRLILLKRVTRLSNALCWSLRLWQICIQRATRSWGSWDWIITSWCKWPSWIVLRCLFLVHEIIVKHLRLLSSGFRCPSTTNPLLCLMMMLWCNSCFLRRRSNRPFDFLLSTSFNCWSKTLRS